MIVERVKRDAIKRIHEWAAQKGLAEPPAPSFAAPPAHVAADLSVP